MTPTTSIVLISGSLRTGSTNSALLQTLQQEVPEPITAILYDGMASLPHFDPGLDRDPLPAPVQQLRTTIHDADAILFCTPEYAGALPGSFKNLLDWTIGDEHPRAIHRKPVAWINVSANITRAADAHESLAKVLRYAHADVISEACAHIPVTRNEIGSAGLINDSAIRSSALNALHVLRSAAEQRSQSFPHSEAFEVNDPTPEVDGRHPADAVTSMIEHVIDLAKTWTAWDGLPFVTGVESEPSRTYTPHKAIRRVADHLLDHLAEIEARIAGRETEPDTWHGSSSTSDSDLALFTQVDLDEAISRLRRLSLIWDGRLNALSTKELDAPRSGAWTIRQVAFHVTGSTYYADSVGRLSTIQ